MTISLQQVAKTFANGTVALQPTDLEIAEGEILSLLGPSGCGKTTLLRILAGLEQGDSGTAIHFHGEEVTHTPVEKRRVGMVFQSYALFPNMSVRGNVGYGLKMQRLPAAEIRVEVDKALSLCKLDGLGERSIKTLSGGQRQRVALARAIAPRPRLLLLDEPLSALDAALRVELRDELGVLLRRFGTTAVFVTHDQSEALAIADRVAVMNAGSIVQAGEPEQLYRFPGDAFVAQFVGGAVEIGTVVEAAPGQCEVPTMGGTLRVKGEAGKRLFVRAECVSIDAHGALTATVENATYHGASYRLALSGICDQTVYANHGSAISPGTSIAVGIDLDKAIFI